MNKYVKYVVEVGVPVVAGALPVLGADGGTTADANVTTIMSNANTALAGIAAAIGTTALLTYAGMKWGWNGAKMAIKWVAGLIH